MEPSTLTLLLLFSVTAAPEDVGLTEPPAATSILPGPPLTAVAVLICVVVEELTVSVACAQAAPCRAKAQIGAVDAAVINRSLMLPPKVRRWDADAREFRSALGIVS
jgi:hypothetical protein